MTRNKDPAPWGGDWEVSPSLACGEQDVRLADASNERRKRGECDPKRFIPLGA
jgi:hypothetical protein